MNDALSTILESSAVERLATGFGFTEGPLWHPNGFLYFVDLAFDVRPDVLRITQPEESTTPEGEW